MDRSFVILATTSKTMNIFLTEKYQKVLPNQLAALVNNGVLMNIGIFKVCNTEERVTFRIFDEENV